MTSDNRIKFIKIDESRNMKRFYVLYPVCDTLLDGVYAVVSEYGRIGRTGRTFVKLFSDQSSAWHYHDHCIATRINHGYTPDQSSDSQLDLSSLFTLSDSPFVVFRRV